MAHSLTTRNVLIGQQFADAQLAHVPRIENLRALFAEPEQWKAVASRNGLG